MSPIAAQRDYWDREAESATFSLPVETSLLAQYLDRSARILDLGCGYGRTLAELSTAGFTNLSGLDPSARMLDRARRAVPSAQLTQLRDLPLPDADDTYDAVLLIAVLTCVPDDDEQLALITEVNRVLQPDGVAYVADFLLSADNRSQNRYAQGTDGHPTYGVFSLADGAVHRHHDPEWIVQLLSQFDQRDYQEFDTQTRHGNPGRAFRFVGGGSASLSV